MATKGQILEFVIDSLARFDLEASNITPEATLESLDIDSLDLAELGQAIKKEFSVDIKPKDFRDVSTIGDALSVVYLKAGLE